MTRLQNTMMLILIVGILPTSLSSAGVTTAAAGVTTAAAGVTTAAAGATTAAAGVATAAAGATTAAAGFSPQSKDELKNTVEECLKQSSEGKCSKDKAGPIGDWDVSSVHEMNQ